MSIRRQTFPKVLPKSDSMQFLLDMQTRLHIARQAFEANQPFEHKLTALANIERPLLLLRTSLFHQYIQKSIARLKQAKTHEKHIQIVEEFMDVLYRTDLDSKLVSEFLTLFICAVRDAKVWLPRKQRAKEDPK